jgi:hypothetical protein
MPSAKGCRLFAELYPPTEQAFTSHHLTSKQRSDILSAAKKVAKSQRQYVKWTFDAEADNGVIIFNAVPIVPDDPIGSHASWLALNTNVGLDPVECRMFVTPVAYNAGQAAH